MSARFRPTSLGSGGVLQKPSQAVDDRPQSSDPRIQKPSLPQFEHRALYFEYSQLITALPKVSVHLPLEPKSNRGSMWYFLRLFFVDMLSILA